MQSLLSKRRIGSDAEERFCVAAKHGNVAEIEAMAAKGINLNCKDRGHVSNSAFHM